MSNPYFQFKQFKINHDRCAMKVGTDGVLLGAWTSIDTLNKEESTRVLDIGTGSGLIALMIAQRTSSLNKLFIDALEIDATASIQAQENVLCSPWKDKISIIHGDFTDANLLSKLLLDNGPYQLIVTNPPYFIDSLNSPNEQRTVARHTQTGLNFEQLIKGVLHLLDANGLFSLIL
ncbi:MAG: methyltransferase, partial [Bacteroidaceae bacterium]